MNQKFISTHLIMIAKIILFLIAVLDFAEVLSYASLINLKDEKTNYESICNEVNITVNFTDLQLKYVRDNFLSSPIITCLNLRSNAIESIGDNAFNNLQNLKYLDMSDNTFDSRRLFSKTHYNLETIILDENKFSEYKCLINCRQMNVIEVTALQPKLKKLFIRNSEKSLHFNVPSKLNFPSLTHLYFSNSKVITDEFSWLPDSLEYLDLSGHALSTLNLNNLINLKYLFLDNPSENILTSISLENLPNLKFLSATFNKISRIRSDTFFNLDSLIFLNLANNDIGYIEALSFNTMQDLKFLNLSNNYIEILQNLFFEELYNLESLDLEKNRITEFPVIEHEMKLKELFLSCNKIRRIVAGNFLKMEHLESLHLHDNEIYFLDQESFAGLINLKTLTLSNNYLSFLPISWMQPLMKIEDLDLTGNLIRDFADLSLSNSSSIKNLYLSNQLYFIETSSLDNIPKNLRISLNSNSHLLTNA